MLLSSTSGGVREILLFFINLGKILNLVLADILLFLIVAFNALYKFDLVCLFIVKDLLAAFLDLSNAKSLFYFKLLTISGFGSFLLFSLIYFAFAFLKM